MSAPDGPSRPAAGSPARGMLVNFALLFLLVQISQRFNIGNSDDVNYVRAGFLTSQVICYLILSRIGKKIVDINDETPLRWKSPTGQDNQVRDGIVRDYDLENLSNAKNQMIMSLVIMGVLHMYFGFVQPLFLQIFMPWTHIVQSPLFKIFIRNIPATGELQRPWPLPVPGFLSKLNEEPQEQEQVNESIENKDSAVIDEDEAAVDSDEKSSEINDDDSKLSIEEIKNSESSTEENNDSDEASGFTSAAATGTASGVSKRNRTVLVDAESD